MRHPSRLTALLAALLGVACAEANTKEGSSGSSSALWSDTGIEAAPGDATWEADPDAGTGAAEDGAEIGYDGLRPVRPDVAPEQADAGYHAGEVVTIAFDLENTGSHDYHHHPGLVLTSDHPDVEIPDAAQWVESLEAGDGVRLEWWAVVSPSACAGDEVRFTATVTAHGCEDTETGCPVAHTASIGVHIE